MELIIKCNDQDIEELFKNRFPDMDKIREDFWRENENGKLKEEIQDLKLENDRLKQRDELMLSFIKDATCNTLCSDCRFLDKGGPCKLNVTQGGESRYRALMDQFYDIYELLEDI